MCSNVTNLAGGAPGPPSYASFRPAMVRFNAGSLPERGYSGHCINLPEDVKELAKSLPRYAKELSLIIVKVRGKDNTFKDVHVR